ncbi:hypothetical protein AM500_19335 [Bacillus sp. FJAT-18017]|uniref:hypothetical protein n=1 Tax=Bacillus sp. FJAT-18017 TaxID=1705566 RepID=UPI0006AFF86B|nr:hypothetical protein [Bacillus sp. FJAT-18017]ALC91696.1 hypothetical protein AM500_19335 [Bacillus sp. FJAT-18017]
MMWLLLLSPLIILIPVVIYLDKKKGAGDPKLDTDNYRIEQDLAKTETYFTTPGGDGPGSGQS